MKVRKKNKLTVSVDFTDLKNLMDELSTALLLLQNMSNTKECMEIMRSLAKFKDKNKLSKSDLNYIIDLKIKE